MPAVRTARLYNRLSDPELSNFSANVITKLGESEVFKTPPVLIPELTALKEAFDQALVSAYKGGKLATALKNAARAALVTALDKNASYVDINCKGDVSLLLTSGYEAVNPNRAQRVLDAPQILAVEYGQTGELKARIKADPNAKTFVGRIKQANGSEFGPSISFKNSRSILFRGLTAGVTYIFEVCAIGGSTGQSDWSEPASKMAL
jgi:hypothetical protein